MSDKAPPNVVAAWERVMSTLNEAEIFMLAEMLADSVRMQQTANLLNTPDSEEDILVDNDIIPMVENRPPKDMLN